MDNSGRAGKANLLIPNLEAILMQNFKKLKKTKNIEKTFEDAVNVARTLIENASKEGMKYDSDELQASLREYMQS